VHDADLLASTHLRMKDYDGSTSPQPELEASDSSLGEMEASDASLSEKCGSEFDVWKVYKIQSGSSARLRNRHGAR
jgi:hypothetical protein